MTDTSAPEGPASAAFASEAPTSKGPTLAGARTIGILGGTFNPPHRGHLALARHALGELGLERVLLMPAHNAPHKGEEGDPGPERRLEMCRLAVGGEEQEGLEACGLEVERGGPSYTVDTLRAIKQSDPEAELTFILGADMARTLPAWREPRALVELSRLAVAEREDTSRAEVLGALAPLSARVRFLAMPTLDVSSSMVRERVRHGEPIAGLVAPEVAEYIAEHRLYRTASENTKANTQAQAPAPARAKAWK
ncbi:MAG TPA: nicotinate-nucleotide adenylyltransferase [Solirubrobacteraceae bacterium]